MEVNIDYLRNAREKNRRIAKKQTYLIFSMVSGLYKIGKSADVGKRSKAFHKTKPEIIAVCNFDVERELHNEFKSRRKFGEWFALCDDEVGYVIDRFKTADSVGNKDEISPIILDLYRYADSIIDKNTTEIRVTNNNKLIIRPKKQRR
jgi:hypothetical protein